MRSIRMRWLAQFQREVAQRSEDVVHRVQGIADAEGTVRMGD